MFVLLLYAYHETSTAKTNLLHFLARGRLSPAAGDMVFTLNGEHSLPAAAFDAPNALVVERALAGAGRLGARRGGDARRATSVERSSRGDSISWSSSTRVEAGIRPSRLLCLKSL